MEGMPSGLLVNNSVEQNIILLSEGKLVTEELEKALNSKPANLDQKTYLSLAATITLVVIGILTAVTTSGPVGIGFVAVALIPFSLFVASGNELTEYEKRVGVAASKLAIIYNKVADHFNTRRSILTASLLNNLVGKKDLKEVAAIQMPVINETKKERELTEKIRSYRGANFLTIQSLPDIKEHGLLKSAWNRLTHFDGPLGNFEKTTRWIKQDRSGNYVVESRLDEEEVKL